MKRLSYLSYLSVKSQISAHDWNTINEFSKYKSNLIKATEKDHFLNKCISLNLIPDFLNFKLPQSLHNVSNKLKTFQISSQKRHRSQNRQYLSRLSRDLSSCSSRLSPDTLKVYNVLVSYHLSKLSSSIQQRHQKKLEKLQKRKNREDTSDTIENVVINNSNLSTLSNDELKALNLGWSMSWPTKPNSVDIKANLESCYSQISRKPSFIPSASDDIKSNLRIIAALYKHQHKKIPSYIKKMICSLKILGKNKNLYISKFDKGNGVHIDDKSTYIQKMDSILSDINKFEIYHPHGNSRNNPFIVLENKFNKKLLTLLNQGKITKEIYDTTKSIGSQPARLYGLPKVHKNSNNPPYRPILSMINAYPSNLAKWLDSILKPFIPNQYCTKDSFEFVKNIQDFKPHPSQGTYIVSYDVVSLFTNVPINDTIQHICELVTNDDLPITKETLRTLLRMASTDIVFSFNNELYKQIDGVSMGSALGPTMAAFAMNLVERNIHKSNVKPLFYKRYVDDIFAVFTSELEADSFLEFLNQQHTSLKFTMEKSKDSQLNFLDVTVIKENNSFETKWYLKETNTGRYISKTSISPRKYKHAAIKSLFFRAHNLCSKASFYKEAESIITEMFLKNGYNINEIKKIEEATKKDRTTQPPPQPETEKIYLKLPYKPEVEMLIQKKVKKIESLLGNNIKITVAYQTTKTANFFPNKDKVPMELRSNIVYKFECEQCKYCYFGETRRHFESRRQEHISGKQPSEIKEHKNAYNHTIKEENFKVIHQSPLTKICESLYIRESLHSNMTLLNDRERSYPLYIFT